MNNYLQTYNKNMERVGILIEAFDIQRKRRLNAEYELAFLVPMISDDYKDKIQLKGYVKDERGQFYIISSRQRVRDGKKLTAAIISNHISYELADYKIPYEDYIAEGYGMHISRLTDILTKATNGRFRFSIDDTFPLFDVKDWGRGNALQAVHHIARMYKCEIDPDNFTIHLRKQMGANNGLQYRIRKNIVGSTFKDDVSSLVTRMHSQMKDGRTFIGLDAAFLTEEERALLNEVPGAIVNGKLAVNYLISPYYKNWASETITYFDGEIIAQDIEDPMTLLEETRMALRKKEIPHLELTINAADLFKLDKAEPKPALGDTVQCLDPEMGMDKLSARIIELTEYPYAMNKHAQVMLANVMVRDYDDMIADLERARQHILTMFSGGRIRTEVFENFAKLAVQDIHDSKTEISYDKRGIILEDKKEKRNQVALTSNGIVISTDGLQTARAAVTARGVVAEQIVGQLGNFVTMEIGTGNQMTKINTHGISAGHQNFSDAPFRVDMNGNVVANSLTANRAKIFSSDFQNGTIVGSRINVGNGTFTVDSNGNMNASSGKFSGVISASEVRGTDIEGGTITGATLRTSKQGRRIEVNEAGLRTYDDSGQNRININTGTNEGTASIVFCGADGSLAGQISSYRNYGELSIYGNKISIGSNDTSNPISVRGRTSFNGSTTFDGSVRFNGDVEGIRINLGDVRGLLEEIRSLKDKIRELNQVVYNLRDKHDKHHHNVSIPSHNHGNPKNQNSGGGEYTTTRPE